MSAESHPQQLRALKPDMASHASRQLNLTLDRWPVPRADGSYDRAAAHRQAIELRCAQGRIAIELWVLEVIPDLYIQACDIQLANIRRRTDLKIGARNRYDTPEAALQAAALKAMRELKAHRRASGLYPDSRSSLLRASNWLEDILYQCNYLLERQVNLF